MNQNTNRPSKKLSKQIDGSQPMLAKEGYFYRVQLPALIKIYPIFLVGSLYCDSNNLLPRQANTPLLPIRVTGDDEYKVQEIIIVRLVRGKLAYKVKQTGADEDLEFYPALDFKYSLHLIKRFSLANPKLPGLPANLALQL